MERKKALVVDDDADRREVLVRVLEGLRFQVSAAADGTAGLTRIEADEPDLILCDAAISGHSAGELCEYVKEFGTNSVPFVLLAGPTDRKQERARQTMGADAVLTHPVEERALTELLRLLEENGTLRSRLAHLEEENRALRSQLTDNALIDPLTRFYRFDLFKQVLTLEVKRAKRYDFPVSIVLLTIDRYEQLAGWLSPERRAQLFNLLRRIIGESIRDIDIPLLFAQEKILVLMPHTPLTGAAVVADRIRERLGAIKPPGSLAELRLTVSLAVASSERTGDVSFGGMVQDAMRALREAALKGGDLVLVCHHEGKLDGEKPTAEVDGKLGPRTFFV